MSNPRLLLCKAASFPTVAPISSSITDIARMLAGIPIFALFVLFEEVINDPKHKDAASNLALLDIAGGHFSRIEYASDGSLPGSLIAEFAKIAREYVNDTNRDNSQHQDQSQGLPAGSIPGILGIQMQGDSTVPISAGEQNTSPMFQVRPRMPFCVFVLIASNDDLNVELRCHG